jgi:hypothetical protein
MGDNKVYRGRLATRTTGYQEHYVPDSRPRRPKRALRFELAPAQRFHFFSTRSAVTQ